MKGFWNNLWLSFALIFRDKAMVLMLIGAPLLYGFYYPWPYSTQIVDQTPIGVIDQEHSALTREFYRLAQASPYIRPIPYATTQQAYHDLVHNKIGAYVVLPYDFTRKLYSLSSVTVPININGAYVLIGKSSLTGILHTLLYLSAKIDAQRFAAAHIPPDKIKFLQDPVPLDIQLRYNPNEGYGNYVVPAVSWLILQQTLLIGAALFIGTLAEKQQTRGTVKAWCARVLALSSINMVMALFYTGIVFPMQGYAHGGNPAGNILLILLFSPTVAILGCLLGLWFKGRERSLQILTYSSLLFYFLSGYSWPLNMMPLPLQWARWLTPSTAAIQAGVHFNQMNATIMQNAQYLLALLILGLVGFVLLVWVGRSKVTKS